MSRPIDTVKIANQLEHAATLARNEKLEAEADAIERAAKIIRKLPRMETPDEKWAAGVLVKDSLRLHINYSDDTTGTMAMDALEYIEELEEQLSELDP